MAPLFTGFRFGFGGGGTVLPNIFSISPGALGSTWTAGVSSDIDITSGDYTFTALSPYTFTAYIWGSGGGSSLKSGGAGGFASATFTGTSGDVYVLKGGFGAGGPNGGNAYGIFTNSFTHANSRLIAGGGGGGSSSLDGAPRSSAGGAGGGATGQTADAPSEPLYSPLSGVGGDQTGPAPSQLQGGTGSSPGPSGGGGGGYYGGGGGGYVCCSVNAGGGGGSGYVHPSLGNPVNNGGNFTTVATSPASASPKRGTAGNVDQPGRIYLTL
jgi:hypothetical protein